MHTDYTIARIVFSVLFLTMTGTGLYMLTGKGARLLSVFAAIPEEKRKLYDEAAISKFGGKLIIAIACCLPQPVVGQVFPQTFPSMLLISVPTMMGPTVWGTGRSASDRYKKKIENT